MFTVPDEPHASGWPSPAHREIGSLPLSRLRRVTEYIRAHLDQDLRLARLGAVVYMSPTTWAVGQNATEVVEFTDERRGSSVAEQLIRKQPQTPVDSTQHDVNPGNQTQQP